MRVEGYSENFSGSKLDLLFDGTIGAWSVSSSNGASISNFKSKLELSGLTVMVQGEPKDGDKFSLEISRNIASNMKVLISDGKKLAATGLHSIEAD